MQKNDLMSQQEMIQALRDPAGGLPDSVFRFISSITPMINVDLLVQDKAGRILLAWRRDICGEGWHIPGGIVRFKETMLERIEATAKKELGERVIFDPVPLKVSEIFMEHQYRGHFISFLYKCRLPEDYAIDNKGLGERDEGYLKWHDSPVADIVPGQTVYRELLNSLLAH